MSDLNPVLFFFSLVIYRVFLPGLYPHRVASFFSSISKCLDLVYDLPFQFLEDESFRLKNDDIEI